MRYPQGIVQLYSCFDILTKIAYELENPKACQDGYAKLSSTKILFGDKNRLNLDPSFTVFEKNRSISMVENLRNELVHNATWEMKPKIFRDTVDGVIRERFILMPDFTEEGTLVTFKNRRRFFADEKKVNIVKNREQLKNAKSRKLFLDLKYKRSTIIVR